MHAIILKDFGGVDQLEYTELPIPNLKSGEVIVQTHAIAINPVDAKTRKGKGQAARLKEDNPMILGWDISGTVYVAGNSTLFKKGDEVFGMINIPGHGKAYAEYVAASEQHITLKPASVSHSDAAAASLAAMTAYQAIVQQAKLTSGQRILVQAASGGVGHYAVQIAKHRGAYVIGSSSAANRDFVLSLGADEHVDYQSVPFEEQTDQVDVVIDAIGGDNIARSLRVLRKGGVIISLPSGLSETVAKQAAAEDKKGIFFFVSSNADDMKKIAEMLESNAIRSHISKAFSFYDIRAAHEHIESGKTVGKIVMEVR